LGRAKSITPICFGRWSCRRCEALRRLSRSLTSKARARSPAPRRRTRSTLGAESFDRNRARLGPRFTINHGFFESPRCACFVGSTRAFPRDRLQPLKFGAHPTPGRARLMREYLSAERDRQHGLLGDTNRHDETRSFSRTLCSHAEPAISTEVYAKALRRSGYESRH